MKLACSAVTLILALAAFPAAAQNVRITPVGSHPGELCANDRAMIFEDPTGVRLLYDTAHNVTGGDDPRLGTIHLVLLSHMHGDHVGDLKLKGVGAGTCANSERVSAAPHGTTAEVAAAKNAALVMTRAMGTFIGSKVQAIRGGKPIAFCPQTNGVTTVPVATVCNSQTDLGGVFIAKTESAARGVEISIVYASHVNNAPPALLTEAQRQAAGESGIVEFGPATGFVVKFTNGLTVYLTGDTGIHSEMKTVVADFHKANLAVLNLGPNPGIFFSGAHAMNELVRPASVILTHPNEPVTEAGKLRPASRTAALMKQLKAIPHLAISGRTMEFDGKGTCVTGC